MSSSLQGLRILNTRPQAQAKQLSQAIHAAGGIAVELPVLEIRATSAWLDSLPDLDTIQYAIFVSANAVEHTFLPLRQQHIHWPECIKSIAIGQGTAATLQRFNIRVHATPSLPDSEHLLALPELQQPRHQNILLFKGAGGRPLIEATLRQKGAHLFAFNVYQRLVPQINRQFIQSIWHDNLVEIILLTSEQSMYHLFKLFPEDAHIWLLDKTFLVISERLAQSASLLGIKNMIYCRPHEIINALSDYVNKD